MKFIPYITRQTVLFPRSRRLPFINHRMYFLGGNSAAGEIYLYKFRYRDPDGKSFRLWRFKSPCQSLHLRDYSASPGDVVMCI